MSAIGHSFANVQEKIYNPTITYDPEQQDFYSKGLTFSTLAQKAVSVWEQQKGLVYEDKPQELSLEKVHYEKVLCKVIPNQDGRKRITNTTHWPHVLNVQITMLFGHQKFGGSGAFVGPHHVLTCGHNVFDPDTQKFADSITVYPALNDHLAPFGAVPVARVYVFKKWTDANDRQYDLALLVLKTSIGLFTGWSGLMCTEDSQLTHENVNIVGYPGDKGFTQMWGMVHKFSKFTQEEFEYEIDTSPGQSGSAISTDKFGQPMIVGVHTCSIGSANFGVRISTEKFIKIVHIIFATFKIVKSDSHLLNSTSAKPQMSSDAIAKPSKGLPNHASTSNHPFLSTTSDERAEMRKTYLLWIEAFPDDFSIYAKLAETLNEGEEMRIPTGELVNKAMLYKMSGKAEPKNAQAYLSELNDLLKEAEKLAAESK